jgi:pimeloyl-ACP methyl ester carboxylesterase
MEDQAKVLALVLDGMAFAKIHIVAHSMGGAVGLLMADKVSGRLSSFVNIEGNLIAEDCGLVSRKTAEVSFEQFRDNMFDRIRSKGPKPWRELSAKSDALGFYRSSVSLVEWSDNGRLLEIFQSLEAEKAYIYGDENASMEILGRLGPIGKISISGSGHFVMNDNPVEFYARLSEIVGKQAPQK